jgi:hypothetical protein
MPVSRKNKSVKKSSKKSKKNYKKKNYKMRGGAGPNSNNNDDWETAADAADAADEADAADKIASASELGSLKLSSSRSRSSSPAPEEENDIDREHYIVGKSETTASSALRSNKSVDFSTGHKSETKQMFAAEKGIHGPKVTKKRETETEIDIRKNIDLYINFITSINNPKYNRFKTSVLNSDFLTSLAVKNAVEKNRFINTVHKKRNSTDPGNQVGYQTVVKYKKDSPEIKFLENLSNNLVKCKRQDIEIIKNGKTIYLLAELLKYLTFEYLTGLTVQNEGVTLPLAQYLMADTKETCDYGKGIQHFDNHYAFKYIKKQYPKASQVQFKFSH